MVDAAAMRAGQLPPESAVSTTKQSSPATRREVRPRLDVAASTRLQATIKQHFGKYVSASSCEAELNRSLAAVQKTAVSQVFGVAELLEAILVELPMRDLLLSQRVSKTFQLTIKGSTKLQRKLFFVPMDPAQRRNDVMPDILIVNPLVAEYKRTALDLVPWVVFKENFINSLVLYQHDSRHLEGSWRQTFLIQSPLMHLVWLQWPTHDFNYISTTPVILKECDTIRNVLMYIEKRSARYSD